MSREQFLDQILLLSSLLHEDQDRELARLGLTPRRTHALWLLHHRGPLIQRDLAAAMEVTPRHVTTLVDELIDAGYVHRRAHPTDRRAVLVSLTERGGDVMTRMAQDHAELAASLTEGWSATDVDDLRERIETVIERLQGLIGEAEAARAPDGAA